MKHVILSIATILFAGLNLNSGDTKLFTYWKKGDTQKIVVSEGFIEYKGEEITKQEITSSNVLLTVLDETDSTYLVEWNYLDMEVDRINVEVEEDPFDKRIDEMFKNVKLVYETDEYGTFKRMVNLQELTDMITDSLEVLVMEELGDSEEESEMFLEMMKDMFNSKEMQDEMTRDIWNYHYYLGDVYASDTLMTYVEELDNKISDDIITAKGEVTIKTDAVSKTIEINDHKTVDEAEAKDAINGVAKKLKAKKKKKLRNELKEQQFSIEDIENYTYDYEYGWLKYYERNRIYKSENYVKERFIKMEEIK